MSKADDGSSHSEEIDKIMADLFPDAEAPDAGKPDDYGAPQKTLDAGEVLVLGESSGEWMTADASAGNTR